MARDKLADLIKGELGAAAFSDATVHGVGLQLLGCQALIHSARQLAAASSR